MLRLVLALIASLLIHLVTGGSMAWWGHQLQEKVTHADQSIDVEIFENQPLVIRDFEPPKSEPLTPEKNDQAAKYRSARRIRVDQETRAAEIGKTANRLPMARPAPPRLKSLASKDLETNLNLQQLTQYKKIEGRPLPVGLSTIGESVDEKIRVGNITALNVDPITYYSFFERLEDLIRHRWEREVFSVFRRLDAREVSIPPSGRWRTLLSIVLGPEGQFKRAIVLQSSGVELLDLAPARAFRQAGQIPNPPAELLNDENEIELVLRFNVLTDAWSVFGARPRSDDSRQSE